MRKTSFINLPSTPIPFRVSLEDEHKVVVLYSEPPLTTPSSTNFNFDPKLLIARVVREGRRRVALYGGPFDMRAKLSLTIDNIHCLPVLPDGILNRYSCTEPLGLTWSENVATVRLFHPRARSVRIVLFNEAGGEPVDELGMHLDAQHGCWSIESDAIQPGQAYGFRVKGPDDVPDQKNMIFCDPYGWIVAKSPGWPVRMLSIVADPSLSGLDPLPHMNLDKRGAMIYEAHLKDVSKLAKDVPEADRGTYRGLSQSSFPAYVNDLGLNAVEWLPLQVYDDREPPFESPDNGWNETSKNHWGYMSAQYFAPEPRYQGSSEQTDWIGTDPSIVHDVRGMVSALHQQNLAVILDVVYNHVGNYGQSPLRHLDPIYWLRHNGDGSLKSESGCGNDLATERPMARRMIVDSLLHWSAVYGIDGFRFDLAGLIDDGTLDAISTRLREDNPNVHLIAEPWGGLYDKHRFVIRGWSAWNDYYRDGIRGHDASIHKGALLGGDSGPLLTHVRGHVVEDGGPFEEAWHSINYLASHDYYNFGDFLRIATRLVKPKQVLQKGVDVELSPEIIKRAKLGFFLLFTSRGMLMLHQGDEWLRAKIVAGKKITNREMKAKLRKLPGQLDRDSYNRDDSTNWLDWEEVENPVRSDIREYVKGMAHLRKKHPALRLARHANLHPLSSNDNSLLAYLARVPKDRLIILVNLNEKSEARVNLPEGTWVVLADETKVRNPKRGRAHTNVETLPPMSARLLASRDQIRRGK